MPGPPSGPFSTPAFKPFIGRWTGFAIFYLFVCVFRLSDVVYLSAMQRMASATTLYTIDIQMAGYASFIGMTMIFPLLFRLKFRFTTRKILTFVTLSLALCDFMVMHIRFVPTLVIIGYISGALRIWGMFECMSSIMTGITPERDFAKFFPVIYATVLGFIQLTGYVCTHLTYLWGWKAMNCMDIILLLLVCASVRLLMRDFRFGPPTPLYGIDWVGMILWSLVLGLITFVATYGEHLEWFHSRHICAASAGAILCLGINLGRMRHIRHPYIETTLFSFPNVFTMMGLFFVMCFLVEGQTVLQNAFTGGILHLDALNSADLNLSQFAGVITGAILSCILLTKAKMTYKALTMSGFALISIYLLMMYFLISPETAKQNLYLPVFVLGVGNVTVYVALTVYAQKVIPFKWFFQGLCVLGFIRTGIANPVCGAILERWLQASMNVHSAFLGGAYTGNLPDAESIIASQATLCSIKEIFGWTFVISIATLLLCLASRYRGKLKYLIPTDAQVYHFLTIWTRRSYRQNA